MEKHLAMVKKLLALNLVFTFFLIGVALAALHRSTPLLVVQAAAPKPQDPLSTTAPQIEERLAAIDQRLEQFQATLKDGQKNTQREQERLVERINQQLPAVLDTYVEAKKKEYRHKGFLLR